MMQSTTVTTTIAASHTNKEADLIEVLQSSDASRKDKMDACLQLARIGGPESIQPLANLLSDEELSHSARYGLEANPDPAVDQVLRDAAENLEGELLVGMIGTLGIRKDPKAVPFLSEKVNNSNEKVAQAAIRALGRISTLDAIKTLKQIAGKWPTKNLHALCDALHRCAENLQAQGFHKEADDLYTHIRKWKGPDYLVKGYAQKSPRQEKTRVSIQNSVPGKGGNQGTYSNKGRQ